MIYDLDEVKDMFNMADELISKNPTLLSMSADQIFDEVDDEINKMRHVRWGVMTRAKIRALKSFEYQDIIVFFLGVEEYTLLEEYIGFILQSEYDISLLGLMLDANQQGLQNQILPFVKNCIEYEEDCFIERIDEILEMIENISEEELPDISRKPRR